MKPTVNYGGPPALPEIKPSEVQAVVEFLQSLEHSQRRPEATARLLVLVVKLYLTRTPWPTRGQVAAHLGISMPLVDVAISQRRAQELIKVVIETVRGSVKRRASVVTHKYIEPCPELIQIVNVDGKRRSAPREKRKPRSWRPETHDSAVEGRQGEDATSGRTVAGATGRRRTRRLVGPEGATATHDSAVAARLGGNILNTSVVDPTIKTPGLLGSLGRVRR